jgi:outer membrane protein assembly factor BamB
MPDDNRTILEGATPEGVSRSAGAPRDGSTIIEGASADSSTIIEGTQARAEAGFNLVPGGRVLSSPAIGSDGTVYVGSGYGGNTLYAIKTDSKGLAKSPWPMRGQNARHNSRVSK